MDSSNIGEILSAVDDRTLTLDNFKPTTRTLALLKRLSKTDTKGQGASGSIIFKGKKAMKTTKPCELPNASNKNMCQTLSIPDDEVITIPYGVDGGNAEVLYMLPNTLSEGIVSGILTGEESKVSNYYGKTFAAYYDPRDKTTYTIMEKYKPFDLRNISDLISQGYSERFLAYYFLHQIAYALTRAQDQYEFTHYDLHPGNVLFDKSKDSQKITLPVSGTMSREYNTDGPNIQVKIIDFGFSRLKYGNTLIEPRTGLNFITSQLYWSTFNPYYDFTSFIGTILVLMRGEKPQAWTDDFTLLPRFIGSSLSPKEIVDMLSVLYNNPPDFDYTKLYMFTQPANMGSDQETTPRMLWRPNHFSPYHGNGGSMNMVALYSLNKMLEAKKNMKIRVRNIRGNNPNFSKQYYPRGITIGEVETYKDKFNVIAPGFAYYVSHMQGTIERWTRENGYKVPSYHHTGAKPNPYQIVHTMFMNSKILAEKGYRLTTACCKMDPRHFMRNHEGAAINGGFFDIKKTFLPIGPYKHVDGTRHINSNLPVPPLYKDEAFGAIVITNGVPSIVNIDDMTKSMVAGASDIVTSGPILVAGGRVIFQKEDILEKNKNNRYPYQCRNPVAVDNKQNKYFTDGLANCTKLEPGELSHASNPNPRSMFLLRDDPDYDMAFVVVEGRENRGDGVDLELLAQFAVDLGATTAINLDGGRSSVLAWNFGNGLIVNNDNEVSEYVAGNILAMIKK